MKKKEIKALAEKSKEELVKMLETSTQQLANLRLQLRAGKLKNIRAVMMERKKIARLKTILRQKELVKPEKEV